MITHAGDELVRGDLVPHWQRQASCLTAPDLPWTQERISVEDAERMGSICAGCPVQTQCSALADETKASAGFWAGSYRTLSGITDPGAIRVRPSPDMPWLDNPPPEPPEWARPAPRPVLTSVVRVDQLELGIIIGAGQGAA